MSWYIPSKTFILGEYAALYDLPALLLTGPPYFYLRTIAEHKLDGIHPDSPAGKLWYEAGAKFGIKFNDPHHGKGGFGASSAQFVGTYLACGYEDRSKLLTSYQHYAWDQVGIRPSGYDVLAQFYGSKYQEPLLKEHLFFIASSNSEPISYAWLFGDLGFKLLATGSKLKTHEHLQQLSQVPDLDDLGRIVQNAHQAIVTQDQDLFIQSIKDYYQALLDRNLVATSTQEKISALLLAHPEILAAKGCGAMGADVILLVGLQHDLEKIVYT